MYTKTGDVLFMSLRTNLQVACVHVSKDSQGSLRGVAVTYADTGWKKQFSVGACVTFRSNMCVCVCVCVCVRERERERERE